MLAVAMLALMVGLKYFTPRLPASLITVAVGIALSGLAGLDRLGISLVGTVQTGLPSFALPDLDLLKQLWPAALGIALMSFVETAAAGRAFIHKGDLPLKETTNWWRQAWQTSPGPSFTVCPAEEEHRRRR